MNEKTGYINRMIKVRDENFTQPIIGITPDKDGYQLKNTGNAQLIEVITRLHPDITKENLANSYFTKSQLDLIIIEYLDKHERNTS